MIELNIMTTIEAKLDAFDEQNGKTKIEECTQHMKWKLMKEMSRRVVLKRD